MMKNLPRFRNACLLALSLATIGHADRLYAIGGYAPPPTPPVVTNTSTNANVVLIAPGTAVSTSQIVIPTGDNSGNPPSTTPEPATLLSALCGVGLTSFWFLRKRLTLP